MLINAVMLGLGVALARASLVAEGVAGDTLVCPLSLAAPTAFAYYLLALPEAVDRPTIALFRSLLVAEATTAGEAIRAISLPQAGPIRDNRIFAAAA
jgi:LysR family glycine cleavage system transcriptional activator